MSINKKMTKEEYQAARDETLTNLNSTIVGIINNFKETPENIADFLCFKSKFYNYSIKNAFLIESQNPYATFCSSYNTFNKLGYQVQKGEKGLTILVPKPYIVYRENAEEPWKNLNYLSTDNKPFVINKIKSAEYQSGKRLSFGIGSVFDISQTNCPPEEYPKIFGVGFENSDLKARYTGIAKYCEACLNCPITIEKLPSISLRGQYNINNHRIVLNEILKDSEKLSVLTHEIGHAMLHNLHADVKNKSDSQIEFESDCISVMLEQLLGVELSEHRKRHLVNSYNGVEWDDIPTEDEISSNGENKLTVFNILNNVSTIFKRERQDIVLFVQRELDKQNLCQVESLELPVWVNAEECKEMVGCNINELCGAIQTPGAVMYYPNDEKGNENFLKDIDCALEVYPNSYDYTVLLEDISLRNSIQERYYNHFGLVYPPILGFRVLNGTIEAKIKDCSGISWSEVLYKDGDREKYYIKERGYSEHCGWFDEETSRLWDGLNNDLRICNTNTAYYLEQKGVETENGWELSEYVLYYITNYNAIEKIIIPVPAKENIPAEEYINGDNLTNEDYEEISKTCQLAKEELVRNCLSIKQTSLMLEEVGGIKALVNLNNRLQKYNTPAEIAEPYVKIAISDISFLQTEDFPMVLTIKEAEELLKGIDILFSDNQNTEKSYLRFQIFADGKIYEGTKDFSNDSSLGLIEHIENYLTAENETSFFSKAIYGSEFKQNSIEARNFVFSLWNSYYTDCLKSLSSKEFRDEVSKNAILDKWDKSKTNFHNKSKENNFSLLEKEAQPELTL